MATTNHRVQFVSSIFFLLICFTRLARCLLFFLALICSACADFVDWNANSFQPNNIYYLWCADINIHMDAYFVGRHDASKRLRECTTTHTERLPLTQPSHTFSHDVLTCLYWNRMQPFFSMQSRTYICWMASKRNSIVACGKVFFSSCSSRDEQHATKFPIIFSSIYLTVDCVIDDWFICFFCYWAANKLHAAIVFPHIFRLRLPHWFVLLFLHGIAVLMGNHCKFN